MRRLMTSEPNAGAGEPVHHAGCPSATPPRHHRVTKATEPHGAAHPTSIRMHHEGTKGSDVSECIGVMTSFFLLLFSSCPSCPSCLRGEFLMCGLGRCGEVVRLGGALRGEGAGGG